MKKSYVLTVLLLFTLSALLLAACGGSDEGDSESADSGAGSVEMEVIMNDIHFGDDNDNIDNPPTWTATAGDSVKVNMVNNGALDHNWAIVNLDETIPDVIGDPDAIAGQLLTDGGTLPAGDSSTWRFTAPADPGDYLVICTVAGHYPSMQGAFTVEAP